MQTVNVNNREFVIYISADEIKKEISRMAAEINEEYKDKRPLFIAILNGSFIFAADLFKEITIECEISFIKLASYKGTKSTGHVITSIGLDEPLQDRHVIILEDIIDTGKTLNQFLPQLHVQQPASLHIAALLHKPEATIYPLDIEFLGFKVPNKFLLGYGLDFDGLGRNLPHIYQLNEEI